MKKKILGKILSVAISLSMLPCVMLTVSATKAVTAFPYSNGFEDSALTGVEYTTSQYAPGNTTMDMAYMCDGTLSFVTLADYPEHGQVMKMKKTKENAGAVGWDIPAIESGKIAFKFDVLSKRNAGITISLGKDFSAWCPVFHMRNNVMVPEEDGSKNITYNQNKWYTVTIIVDKDNNVARTYVNGIYGTYMLRQDTIENPVRNINIRSNASNVAESIRDNIEGEGEDGIYIDNVVIKKIDSDTVKVKLSVDGNKIGNYAPLTDYFAVEFEEDDFALDSKDILAETKLIDLGSDILSVSNIDIPLYVDKNGSKYELSMDNPLIAGHKYRLELPSELKSDLGRGIENNVFTFIASENGGMATHIYYEDFSSVEELNELNSDTLYKPISNKTPYITYRNANGTYELVSNNDLTGGNGLRITDTADIGLSFARRIREGKLRIYGKVKMNALPHLFLTWLSPAGNNGIGYVAGVGDTKIPTVYQWFQAPATTPNTIYALPRGSFDEYSATNILPEFTYDMSCDFDKGTIESFNYNDVIKGERSAANLSDPNIAKLYNIPANASAGKNIIESGIDAMSVSSAAAGYDCTIDYLGFEYTYEIPTVISAVFVKNGAEFTCADNETVSPETEALKITFTKNMYEPSLEGIKLMNGENEVQYTGSYDFETNTYTMNFAGKLIENTAYAIKLPADVRSDSSNPIAGTMEGIFTTGEGRFEISNLRITDKEGNALSGIDDFAANDIKISADVVNTKSKVKNVTLVFAGYNAKALSEMKYADITVNPGEVKTIEFTPELTNKAGITILKGFALNNMKDIKPFTDAVVFPEL